MRQTRGGGAFGRARRLLARFLGDNRGNYGMMTTIALVPVIGGLALALDFAEMNRQKQATLNALDAAGVATAQNIMSGASDALVKSRAKDFFEANLGHVDPADTTLHVDLPTATAGGGTLKLSAELRYQPYFLPAFRSLLKVGGAEQVEISAKTELRLKNTLEVALVLDNSGSMDDDGADSGEKRIDLLKDAAKQLVDTLSAQAKLIKQVDEPVRFSLVPFAASVNVGPANAGQPWMDSAGVSPVHHENFDWTTLSATVSPEKYAEQSGAGWVKRGPGWDEAEGQPLTRFSLYQDMRKVVSRERIPGSKHFVCYKHRDNGTCKTGGDEWDYDETPGPFASWQGCVEARPHPYNINDAPASTAEPASLFVPMFAPDEPGDKWKENPNNPYEELKKYGASNNWWTDGFPWGTPDHDTVDAVTRQKNMRKYYDVRPHHAPTPATGSGPNHSCTTNAITPLTDVTTETGLASIKTAIDDMEPIGGTNVPEGLAWGWRAVSSAEPFAEGRPDTERGNDKVVIVLTDGENTYYTPGSLGYNDPAGSKSTYSSYGYMSPGYNGGGDARLFLGTSSAIGRYDYSNGNYSNAMNEQMAQLCSTAKAAGILVMTVALDLDEDKPAQAAQIAALRKCSSDSRFRNDPHDASKAAKLFWNATGDNLAEKFEEIADELSNLRFVG